MLTKRRTLPELPATDQGIRFILPMAIVHGQLCLAGLACMYRLPYIPNHYQYVRQCPMTDNSGLHIRLDHMNLPARKPEWLAQWYAETFGFQAQDGFVLGAGTVLVFEIGEPLIRPGRVQFGFRCNSRDQVVEWANKLSVALENESVYCGFRTTDPEGYVFEVYWESNSG